MFENIKRDVSVLGKTMADFAACLFFMERHAQAG